MNDIKVLGRIVADMDLSYSNKERPYVWFTVAAPRRNNRDEADFIRCVAFDKLAESLTEYCVKGRQVLVNGRLEVSQRINKETQANQIYYSVISESIEFLQRPQAQILEEQVS